MAPTPAVTPPATLSRRALTRAATVAEIKATALDLMREQGTPDLRLADIARRMGMTAPALYRYFPSRDDLLDELITECFEDLGRCVREAHDAAAVGDLGARLHAAATAYRRWAADEPARFALLFGTPVPGYAAPEDGPTTEAAQRAWDTFILLATEARDADAQGTPREDEIHPALASAMGVKCHGLDVAPEVFAGLVQGWAILHGFVVLEAWGHLHWLPPEAREPLFESTVALIAECAGLPRPGEVAPG